MTPEMEKLIEDTAIYFQAYYEERRFDPTIPDRSKDYAGRAITRISQAIARGEMKLPGERDWGRIRGHILHFPHDDKPWTPATHFRAEGSHSSLALANGLIGIDGEEAMTITIALRQEEKK